jgi:hypothetical protein
LLKGLADLRKEFSQPFCRYGGGIGILSKARPPFRQAGIGANQAG